MEDQDRPEMKSDIKVAPNSRSPLTALENYNLFKHHIDFEHNLIVQRLSWLLGSQAFLFSAYAIGAGVTSPKATVELLVRLIPIVAILSSALIYIAVLAALVALQRLRSGYVDRFQDPSLPNVSTSGAVYAAGSVPPIFLPLVFIVVWALLLNKEMQSRSD
jgi:hypothetical protein